MSTQPKQIREEKLFTGGMDSDSNHRFVIKGDYLYARNMMKGEDGDNGTMVNVKGTKLIDGNYTFPGNNKKCLGVCTDWDNDTVIVFVSGDKWGGFSWIPWYSVIVQVDAKNNNITKITDSSILNFDKNHPIQANVIDGILYFTDNYNPPRKLNIQRALGNDGSYSVIDDKVLDVAKCPPLYKMIWDTGHDSNFRGNNIIGKPFQFREKYIYDDHEESVWGNTSDVIFAKDNYKSIYVSTGDYGDDNYISISFRSGHETVTNIKIAARESITSDFYEIVNIDKQNPINVYGWDGGDFFLMTLPLDDNTFYQYYFYNDTTKKGLDQEKVAKHYDRVPRLARSQEIFGNRLGYGGVTLGYNKPSAPYMSASAVYNELNNTRVLNYVDAVLVSSSNVSCYGGTEGYVEVEIDIDFSFLENVVTPHTITMIDIDIDMDIDSFGIVSGGYLLEINNDDYNNKSAYIDFAKQRFIDVFDDVWFDCVVSGNKITITDSFFIANNEQICGKVCTTTLDDTTTCVSNIYNIFRTIKKGTKQTYAIEYLDKHGFKLPIVTRNENEQVKLLSQLGSGHRGDVKMGWQLTGSPPVEAYYYQLLVGDSKYYSDFIQLVVKDVKTIDDDGVNYALDVSSMTLFEDDTKQVLDYNFEKGDRITLLKQGDYGGFDGSAYVSWQMDVQVLDVRNSITSGSTEISGLWLVIADPIMAGWDRGSVGGSNGFMNSLIEIYKPAKNTGEERFHEVGEMYPISNAGTSSRAFSVTSGEFYGKHAWFRTREFVDSTGKRFATFIEDPNIDDINVTKMDGTGRFNIEEQVDRDEYQNDIRWSGKWYEDTRVNGLSTFDWDAKVEMTDKFGKINNIVEVGDVLKAVTDRKIFSLYIGARVLKNIDENENVAASKDVIGTVRPSSQNYGSQFASSILQTGRHLFGYDMNTGVIWRDSANGTYPISGKISTGGYEYDYKMHDYIRNKSKLLKVSGVDNVNVYAGYDSALKVVYFAFIDDSNSDNNEVLLFHEPSNRWIGTIELNDGSGRWVQGFGSVGQHLVSYANSSMWLHNSDDVDRCNIYGDSKDYEIKFVANQHSNQIKLFNSLAIHSNKEWEASLIEIPVNMNYDKGMVSRLKKAKFSKHEGVMRAAFLKNMKTTSDTPSKLDLLTGEDLRGEFVDITLKGDSPSKVELSKVDIDSELSK